MGRVNYGPYLADRKGIQRVRLGMQLLFGWEVYTLPMENLSQLSLCRKERMEGQVSEREPFPLARDADCFVDMKGFKKGIVLVNGVNIGRYWSRGPQRTLYLPAPFLKERNEIIILDQEGSAPSEVPIIDRHMLG